MPKCYVKSPQKVMKQHRQVFCFYKLRDLGLKSKDKYEIMEQNFPILLKGIAPKKKTSQIT